MRKRIVHWRGAPIALASALVIALAAPTPASALTLFQFTGKVADNLGRPIANATVTDGLQNAQTAADGTYTLSEGATGQYTLRSYRSDGGTTSQTVTVSLPLPTTVDFTPESGHPFYFKAQSNVIPSTVTTLQSSQTLQLSIQSWAPAPVTNCVYVTDSRTGTRQPATYVGMSGSQSNWVYSVFVPLNAPQGYYTLTSEITDCTTGRQLNNPATNPRSSYTVDNTPPTTDPKSVIPTDHGNTAFVVQPLSAVIHDTGGAGVKQSSIRFDLTDTSANPPTMSTFTNVSYNTGTERATVLNSGTLVIGHAYSLTINAMDNAGNVAAAVTTSFAVLKLVLPVDQDNQTIQPTANIPPTASSSSTFDVGSGTTFEFDAVPLDLGDFTVNIVGQSAHDGFGYMREDVDLTKATIALYKTVTVNGQSQDQYLTSIAAPAMWGTANALTQWRLTAPTDTVNPSAFVSASQPAVKKLTLTTAIPGADKAVVSMTSHALVVPDSTACANPTQSCGSLKYATPDPLPFYFSAEEAAQMAANEITRDQSLYDLAADTTVPSVQVNNPVPSCRATLPLSSQYNCIATYESEHNVTSFTWQALLNATNTDDDGDPTWDLVAGAPEYYQLLYQGDVAGVAETGPLVPPVNYPAVCGLLPCNITVANANTTASGPAPDPYDAQQKCIKEDSSIDDSGHPCYQYVTLQAGEYQGLYVDSAGHISFNDPAAHLHSGEMNNTKGWHNADEDHMSIGLQTNDVGWTPKITLGRGYYRNYPSDPNNAYAPCQKPVFENEAGASYNQNRQPTDPDPDVQLVYTNVANMLRLKQGPLYDRPCDFPQGTAVYQKHKQLGRAWMGWTTVNPQGNQGRGGTAFVEYGHDKSSWRGRGWSCSAGPSAGAGGASAGAGCSYGAEYQTSTDWWMYTHAEYLY